MSSSTKKESGTQVEEKPDEKSLAISRFFRENEDDKRGIKNALVRHSNDMETRSTKARLGVDCELEQAIPSTSLWRIIPIPDIVQISPLLEKLHTTEAPKTNDVEDGMEILKRSLLESQDIETVRKENFFNEEITEEERDIIATRVALQQRQFAAYEYREKVRKSTRIRSMFDYVSDEEITELLKDCEQDEDEVVYRLTKPGYLYDIRKAIALKYAKEESSYKPVMTAEQRLAYEHLVKKRSEMPKKTTNDQAKKQYRLCSRLGLDEALQQFQNQVDPEKAFEGWSEARIKAYQMIDVNPNSYYYRFNAPGEIQRKGQWDENEKRLFHARLAELGVGGESQQQAQWGIFSMKIPGRVGYQCSNYYRLLIETKQVVDPNYVLDERGKAHFLFEKKDADGQIQKTFRTHTKNTSSQPTIIKDFNEPSSSSTTSSPTSRASRKITTTTVKKQKMSKESEGEPSVKPSKVAIAGSRKRRRPRYDDSDIEADFDNDYSGSFTTRSHIDNAQRKSERRRRPTIEAMEAGLTDESWCQDEEPADDPTCPLPGFVDPITLEQVIKPAISKYGHVMGYDSWVRCLNNWEGKRNICPLTKKPLTKRDLVVLTFDNLNEYKDKIVNM